MAGETIQYDPETARIVREALERAACKIEKLEANKTYKLAYRIAARVIRSLKPD